MDENKPLIDMTDKEREAAFDSISKPLDLGILADARNCEVGKERDVLIAVAVLVTADGRRCVCHAVMEYGDGEGTQDVSDFTEKSRRLLQPGERLYSRVVGLNLPEDQLEELGAQ